MTFSQNEKREQITRDNIIEYSARKYVGRFLDTVSKEAISKYDDDENRRLIKLAELARAMKEAAEGNRRHNEINGRKEQDELLKQVIKILLLLVFNYMYHSSSFIIIGGRSRLVPYFMQTSN